MPEKTCGPLRLIVRMGFVSFDVLLIRDERGGF